MWPHNISISHDLYLSGSGMKNRATTDSIFSKYKPSPTFYQAFDLENETKVQYWIIPAASHMHMSVLFHRECKQRKWNFSERWFSFHINFGLDAEYLFTSCLAGFLEKFCSGTYQTRLPLLLCWLPHLEQIIIVKQSTIISNHMQCFSAHTAFIVLRVQMAWWSKSATLLPVDWSWMDDFCQEPSEIVCLLIPLLWNVYDKQSLNAKIQLIKKYRSHVWLLILCGILVFIPQFYYWYKVTGSPFFQLSKNRRIWFYKTTHPERTFSFKRVYWCTLRFWFSQSLDCSDCANTTKKFSRLL